MLVVEVADLIVDIRQENLVKAHVEQGEQEEFKDVLRSLLQLHIRLHKEQMEP